MTQIILETINHNANTVAASSVMLEDEVMENPFLIDTFTEVANYAWVN